MNQLIGLTIKTHDNGYIGKVKDVKPIAVGTRARGWAGLLPSDPYIALAVQIDESPKGWTTLIAGTGWDIHKKYVLA